MRGDEEKRFEAMYRSNRYLFRRIVADMQVPYEDREDIVQEAVIAYLGHYSLKWSSRRQLDMLSRIIKNKCVDYFRRNAHERVAFHGERFPEDCYVGREGTAFEDMELAEVYLDLVERLICHMGFGTQEAARLYFLEGLDVKSIAERLHISDVACRQRISRARQQLRAGLREEESPIT